MSDREWAAGLFEGEGSISPLRRGEHTYPNLQLAMTDEDVVARFVAAVGVGRMRGPYGPYESKDGSVRKPAWQWSASGVNARAIMAWMLPLLGARRRARWEELS